MASSIQEKARDAFSDLPDANDLRKELAQLRGQVEKMMGKASSNGGAQIRRLGADASDRVGGLLHEGEALFGDVGRGVGRELRNVEKQATATVRERPVQSVALAIGVGFALAFLLRR